MAKNHYHVTEYPGVQSPRRDPTAFARFEDAQRHAAERAKEIVAAAREKDPEAGIVGFDPDRFVIDVGSGTRTVIEIVPCVETSPGCLGEIR